MNRPELYRKTVDILYAAYFNDTLEHGNCAACAVGNMVAAGCGYSVIKDMQGKSAWNTDGPRYSWNNLFTTVNGQQSVHNLYRQDPYVRYEIASTGYPWYELAKIEYAFETADAGTNEEDYMFNGLVAVLEVLKQLHEVEDDTIEISRFKEHHERKVLVERPTS
jgi:hypothetical protein